MNTLRYCVGEDVGLRSAIWVFFLGKDDVYIAPRHVAGQIKVSIHGAKMCRLAITRQHADAIRGQSQRVDEDRAFVHWDLPSIPDDGALHVTSIVIPTRYLSKSEVPLRLRKPLRWITPAPKGHAAEIGVFLHVVPMEDMEPHLDGIGTPLASAKLASGVTVSLVGRNRPFDPTSIEEKFQSSVRFERLTREDWLQPGESQSDLSMVIWNDPIADGGLQLIELGSVDVKRN